MKSILTSFLKKKGMTWDGKIFSMADGDFVDVELCDFGDPEDPAFFEDIMIKEGNIEKQVCINFSTSTFILSNYRGNFVKGSVDYSNDWMRHLYFSSDVFKSIIEKQIAKEIKSIEENRDEKNKPLQKQIDENNERAKEKIDKLKNITQPEKPSTKGKAAEKVYHDRLHLDKY